MVSILKSKINKKANVFFEVTTIMLIIITLGIAFISFDDSSEDLQDSFNNDDFLSNSSKKLIENKFDKLPSIADSSILFLLILLWVGAILASLFINVSPVLVPIMGILLTFVIYIFAQLANTFFDLTSSMNTASFPYTVFIVNHITIISTIMGFSVIAIMFAKVALK